MVALEQPQAYLNGVLSGRCASRHELNSPFLRVPRHRSQRIPANASSNMAFSSIDSSLSQQLTSLVVPHRRQGKRTVLARGSMAVESEATTTQATQVLHVLPSGLRMEVLIQKADSGQPTKGSQPERPPLLFVHGSYHAAWCWAEYWMPFFVSQGFDCYASSILGQVGVLSRARLWALLCPFKHSK